MMFPRMTLLIGEPVLSFRKKMTNDAKARALPSATMFPQNPDVVSRSRKKRAIPPSATSTGGNGHWRPVNGLDQRSSQTPEQRCYHQKNRSEEALWHSCCAHSLAASQARSTADCAARLRRNRNFDRG